MFWAVELVSHPQTREAAGAYGGSSPAMNEVIAACKANGMLPFANYNGFAVPSCNVTDAG